MKAETKSVRINNTSLTVEQAISYARLRYSDYIKILDYDYFDWLEWTKLHKN